MPTLRLAAAFVLLASAASADDLPKNLTLQCSGNFKSMKFYPVRDKSPQFSDGVFNITVQLKDKVIVNLSDNEVLGKDCFLEKGEIGCSFDETRYIERMAATERNQGSVLIKKDTGAARLLHSHFVFGGTSATGRPGATEKLERTGVCRTVKSPTPLF